MHAGVDRFDQAALDQLRVLMSHEQLDAQSVFVICPQTSAHDLDCLQVFLLCGGDSPGVFFF